MGLARCFKMDYVRAIFSEREHQQNFLIEKNTDPAGVAQWAEHQPVNQRVTAWIPSQGTCLGLGPGPQQGAHKRQLHIDVSLPLSPSLPFFLKINK